MSNQKLIGQQLAEIVREHCWETPTGQIALSREGGDLIIELFRQRLRSGGPVLVATNTYERSTDLHSELRMQAAIDAAIELLKEYL